MDRYRNRESFCILNIESHYEHIITKKVNCISLAAVFIKLANERGWCGIYFSSGVLCNTLVFVSQFCRPHGHFWMRTLRHRLARVRGRPTTALKRHPSWEALGAWWRSLDPCQTPSWPGHAARNGCDGRSTDMRPTTCTPTFTARTHPSLPRTTSQSQHQAPVSLQLHWLRRRNDLRHYGPSLVCQPCTQILSFKSALPQQ